MWIPQSLDRDLPRYRAITECLARDITQGLLAEGDRLPPLRDLAERLGVTVGTVLRAYDLAEQRGLIVKQTGRGTFVRSLGTDVAGIGEGRGGGDMQPVDEGVVDLSRNEPPYINLEAQLRRSLQEISRDSNLDGMLEYGQSQGLARHRDILCRWLRGRGFPADPEHLIITGGAQQALTTTLGALTVPGDTVLVEALSYPGIRNLARFFGLNLVPVAMDEDGLLPDALERACIEQPIRALYCMPYAHNPTTATLPLARRRRLAELAERHGFYIIEDDVNPRPVETVFEPICGLQPTRTIYISSLSKTVAPGLRLGLLAPPESLLPQFLAASRTTSWMAPPLMAELACHWIQDGTAKELETFRAEITRGLLGQAERHLRGVTYFYNSANAHIWLPLPEGWRAGDFAAASASRGVRVSPSDLFAVDPARAPTGVRINLTNVGEAALARALTIINELWHSSPQPTDFHM